MMSCNMEIGALVKWYEPYADGFMTRDYGHGIILNIKTHDVGYKSGPYKTYTVYRSKHSDIMSFSTGEIEEIE